jgi:hypothetical protein
MGMSAPAFFQRFGFYVFATGREWAAIQQDRG